MKLKQLIAGVLATVALVATFGLVGCGDGKTNDGANNGGNNNGGKKYVATNIESEENEQYAFAIGKNATKKTEILNAMNKVIEGIDIEKIVTYYQEVSESKTPSVTLEFANLADNTAGTLQVYTNATFEPFEFRDDDDNIVGVDMYIMELVAEELNMKVKFNDMDFDGIVGKVAMEDNAIGAAGMTVNAERLEKVDFSNTYFSTVQSIISLESEKFDTLDDLKGKKIGVQKGTTGWLLVDEAINNGVLKGTGAEVISYDNGPLAYAALKAGKCDVVVIDELPANKLVK